MTLTKSNYSLLAAVVSLMSVSLLTGAVCAKEKELYKTKLVEGTDPAYEAQMEASLKADPTAKQLEKEDRAVLRHERLAMKKDGYVIVDAEYASLHHALAYSPYVVGYQSILPLLGFEPAAFNLGYEIAGVLYDEAEDRRIHSLTTLLKHPQLDIVLVSERSLATEPKGKRAKYLTGPKFDRKVNGNPALLRVYRTESGDSGRSVLSVLREDKLYTVSFGLALAQDDPLSAELFRIAAQI